MTRQARLLLASLITAAAAQPSSSRAKVLFAYSGSTPVLDGIIHPDEWSDAFLWSGIADWDPEFQPVAPNAPVDLNLTFWVKHDDSNLYFAFLVTDDVLYGFQTPSWLPSGNAFANNLTQAGWPWFGDEVEILLNAGNFNYSGSPVGNGSAWQMVCNLHKSRLGGVGTGGLLEGEPRSSNAAWETYQTWILSGAQRAAVRATPRGAPDGGNLYVFEWAVAFQPCVELAPGVFYESSMPPTSVGINIAMGDTDAQAASDGNVYGLRHEMWLNGSASSNSSGGNPHTLFPNFGTLWLMPGPMPPL